jgi:hypothetical protein
VLAVVAGARFIAIRTNLRDLDGIVDSLILCCALGVVLSGADRRPAARRRRERGERRCRRLPVPAVAAGRTGGAVHVLGHLAARQRLAAARRGARVRRRQLGFVVAPGGPGRGAPPTWVGALWLLSILCVVLAAAHPSRAVVTQVALPGLSRVPYARLVIMALALVAAPVVGLPARAGGGIGLVPAVGSLVLMVLVVVRLLRVVVGRERARSLLVVRSEQQAAVVRLGLRALAGSEPARLLDEAVAAVAAALRVDHCAVLEATSAETLVRRVRADRPAGDRVGDGGRVVATLAEPFVLDCGTVARDRLPRRRPRCRGGRTALLRGVVSGVSVPLGTPAHRSGCWQSPRR